MPELLTMYKDGVGFQLEIDGPFDSEKRVRNLIVEKQNYEFIKNILLSKGYKKKAGREFKKGRFVLDVYALDELF